MWCAIDLCLLTASGYFCAATLARRASSWEIAAIALCIGPGIVGFVLILLSMLGIKPNRMEVVALCAVFVVAGIWAWMFRRGKAADDLAGGTAGGRIPSAWLIVCACAIGFALTIVAIDALRYPVVEWDAFAIWQLKGEVLFNSALHPLPGYFTNVSLSYSHLRYPLLVPMLAAQMHAMTGRADDLAKVLGLIFFAGMCLAVFATVKRMNGPTPALAAAALVACGEPICRYGGSGTAELPLTAFYACSLLCFFRWREKREAGYLVLTAIISGLMAWTKNEGLALAAIYAVFIAMSGSRELRSKSIGAAAIFVGIVAVMYLPWVMFSWGLPRTDEDYAGRLASMQMFSQIGRLGRVLLGIGQGLIDWENWGIFWIIVLLLALAERKKFRDRDTAVLGLLLVAHLLAYVPAFMVTNWNLNELLGVTIDRLLMHAAPAGAMLIGFLWPIARRAPRAERLNNGDRGAMPISD